MSRTGFLRSLTAATLAAAIFAASPLITLAASGKTMMGELTVTGANVTVNGETANTGRTIFSSNTIATPANSGAVVNLGALGQIELAPNSSINLTFDENGISGTLTNGQVKVDGASNVRANINTATGTVAAEAVNEAKAFTVNFNGAKTEATSELGTVTLNENGKAIKVGNKQTDDDQGFFTGQSIVYAVLFGVAAGTLIYIAARDNNEVNASSAVVVSPIR